MNSAPAISPHQYCTEGENNDENEHNGNRKTGSRPLAAHTPGAGVKVIKTGIRLVRYAAALTVLALTIKRGAGGGSAISVAQVTGLSW